MYRLPADVVEPEFAELLGYWESKRRGGGLPTRSDIDPVDLRSLLPHLLLFDVAREGDRTRFRFRLAGTAFTTLVGRDVTGLCLDELGPPERVAPVIDALTRIVRTARPCYLASRPTLHSEQFLMAKCLGVPLAADGQTVDMILAVWLVLARPAADSAADAPPEGGGEPILLAGD